MTRREAFAKGDLTYQGNDCPRGHGGERYTRTNDCKLCSQERSHKAKVNFREAIQQVEAGQR